MLQSTRNQRETQAKIQLSDLTRLAFVYVLIPRDKSITNPIVTLLNQLAKAARVAEEEKTQLKTLEYRQVGSFKDFNPAVSLFKPNVIIQNKDAQLTDQISKLLSFQKIDSDIVYYQMLFQCWRKRPGVFIQRSLIMTPSVVILAFENLHSLDVDITVLDQISFKQITELYVEKQNPFMFTFVIKDQRIFSKSRKWRLYLENRYLISKLLDTIKVYCAEVGNNL